MLLLLLVIAALFSLAVFLGGLFFALQVPKIITKWQAKYYCNYNPILRLLGGGTMAESEMARRRSMLSRWQGPKAAMFTVWYFRSFILFISFSMPFLGFLLVLSAILDDNKTVMKIYDLYGGYAIPVIMGILMVLFFLAGGLTISLRLMSDIPLIRIQNMTNQKLKVYIRNQAIGEVAPNGEVQNKTVSAYHPNYRIEARNDKGDTVYTGEFTLEQLEDMKWNVVIM